MHAYGRIIFLKNIVTFNTEIIMYSVVPEYCLDWVGKLATRFLTLAIHTIILITLFC